LMPSTTGSPFSVMDSTKATRPLYVHTCR
jgi:hypothetical protein